MIDRWDMNSPVIGGALVAAALIMQKSDLVKPGAGTGECTAFVAHTAKLLIDQMQKSFEELGDSKPPEYR